MARSLPRLIGVIHLPPLPGSPGAANLSASSALAKAGLWAVKEAKILEASGFDGIILENFGDIPFYKDRVKPETIASLSVIAAAVRETTRSALGINVLRNDAFAALAIAAATGADFIRVNVLAGVVATDQGLIEGQAAELVRERLRLNASNVAILADVHVKHAQTLSSVDLAITIEEVAGRGGADGVILTGSTTGRLPSIEVFNQARLAASKCKVPLYLGSGMTADKIREYAEPQVGLIVGSALRRGGLAGGPMDPRRVKKIALAWKTEQKRLHGKTRRATS